LLESATVELRPYQEAALAAWELATRRGTAVLPTGSGKTRLAIAAMVRANVPALCLVPTRVLLDQWARAIRELVGFEPGRLGDGEHRIDTITVATFESAWRHMHRLGNQFDLLVVDEAHHFGTGMRDEALDMCTAPLRLGLTATKPRGQAAARLDELVGPTIYELRIDELTGEFLAPFDTVVLHLDLTSEERTEYESLMAVFRDVMHRFRRFQPRRHLGRIRQGRGTHRRRPPRHRGLASRAQDHRLSPGQAHHGRRLAGAPPRGPHHRVSRPTTPPPTPSAASTSSCR
jgi:superfamily II DNA or RNA helicase